MWLHIWACYRNAYSTEEICLQDFQVTTRKSGRNVYLVLVDRQHGHCHKNHPFVTGDIHKCFQNPPPLRVKADLFLSDKGRQRVSY